MNSKDAQDFLNQYQFHNFIDPYGFGGFIVPGLGRMIWNRDVSDDVWTWVPDQVEARIPINSFMTLNKGDKAVLKSSNRLFEVIDERNLDGFEELCKFEDDPRHPVWLSHSELSGESRYMTDEEREKWNRRHD